MHALEEKNNLSNELTAVKKKLEDFANQKVSRDYLIKTITQETITCNNQMGNLNKALSFDEHKYVNFNGGYMVSLSFLLNLKFYYLLLYNAVNHGKS